MVGGVRLAGFLVWYLASLTLAIYIIETRHTRKRPADWLVYPLLSSAIVACLWIIGLT